jgi:hypothetical protein
MKIMSYYHLHYLPLMQIWLYYLPLMKICLYYLPLMKIRLSAVIRITFSHIPPLFLWSCVAQSLAFCVLLWGPLLVCLFFFYYIVCTSSIYSFRLPLWYLPKCSCNNQMLKYWGKSFKIFSSHVSRLCWIKQYFFILWVLTLIC